MNFPRWIILANLFFALAFVSGRGSEPIGIVPLLSPELAFLPKKPIAPYVAEAVASYKAARARFVEGLPRGDKFFVSCRCRDALLNPTYFVVIKVTQIPRASEKIIGKIFDVPGTPRARTGDSVEILETQIIDWKIVHADGSIEGNVVGQYLASLGSKVDIDIITEDQREADIRELGDSPLLGETLDKSILQFFDDPALVIERGTVHSNVTEWPALAAKFKRQTRDIINVALSERVHAVKGRQKVEIEKTDFGVDPILLATFSFGFKKGGRPLLARQIIQFDFNQKSETLKRVTWGFRTVEALVVPGPPSTNK